MPVLACIPRAITRTTSELRLGSRATRSAPNTVSTPTKMATSVSVGVGEKSQVTVQVALMACTASVAGSIRDRVGTMPRRRPHTSVAQTCVWTVHQAHRTSASTWL